MAESEISSLKEALRDQSIVMTKLYTELEEERKASASAANETLCMILRLQEEKATEKMEASHYKRMAEEKLWYAEESLAFLQEVLHQKDLEIDFLKCQIAAYEHRIFGTGTGKAHFGISEMYDSPSLNNCGAFSSKRRPHQIARRNISLPAIQFEKLCSEMGIIDENDDSLLVRENYVECNMPRRCALECNSDSEQAQEVKLKAKEVMRSQSIIERVRSISGSTNNERYLTAIEDTLGLLDFRSCSCCKAVLGQAITEVPRNLNGCNVSESNDQRLSEPISEAKNTAKIPISLSQEAAHSLKEDELLHEAMITSQKSFASGISPYQADIEQLKERLLQLEDDRKIMKQESSERSKEQLKMLQEIGDQINAIQLLLKGLKFKKPPPKDDPMFVSLMEAMLHFSI